MFARQRDIFLKKILTDIATLSTGIYAPPDLAPDTLYLQSNHFINARSFDNSVRPQIKYRDKYHRHLLRDDDLLFVAKGFNNYAVVYKSSIGKAVASSSFIVIRMKDENYLLAEYLAWYLTNSKQVKVLHNAKKTTTIPSISIDQLSKLEISIPPISMQKSITNIQKLRDKEKDTLKLMEALKDQLTKETLLNAAKK
jgi:restriction endonuclease S subunit